MPTSSITKQFIINNNNTCDKLINAMKSADSASKCKSGNSYEYGMEQLHKYFDDKKATD